MYGHVWIGLYMLCNNNYTKRISAFHVYGWQFGNTLAGVDNWYRHSNVSITLLLTSTYRDDHMVLTIHVEVIITVSCQPFFQAKYLSKHLAGSFLLA